MLMLIEADLEQRDQTAALAKLRVLAGQRPPVYAARCTKGTCAQIGSGTCGQPCRPLRLCSSLRIIRPILSRSRYSSSSAKATAKCVVPVSGCIVGHTVDSDQYSVNKFEPVL
jgi:hypothetical protein